FLPASEARRSAETRQPGHTETAGVHPSCGARASRNGIGLDPDAASTPEAVGVQIDEARSDSESLGIDDVECPIRWDTWLDGGDSSIQDSHIGSVSKPSARVVDLTVLDQDVVTLKLLSVG